MLSEQLDRELGRLASIIEQDLGRLNELLRALGLEEIDVNTDGESR